MAFRLSRGVQVRKESPGLLFYSQAEHRIFFVASGDWLYPGHFDGTWTFDALVDDVARRGKISTEAVTPPMRTLTTRLVESGVIVS